MIDPTSALAVTNRPSGGWLFLACCFALAALVVWRVVSTRTRPPRPVPVGDTRPSVDERGRLESPAIVALLTNDYEVPTSAVTATALDLAARGWISIGTTTDNELVVLTRGRGSVGDVLLPFEQQVLNHLVARSFDGVTSASTLEASRSRLGRRWRWRFRRSVARSARRLGATRARVPPLEAAVTGAVTALALWCAWLAWRNGTDEGSVGETWRARAIWVLALVAGLVVAARLVRVLTVATERPTDAGARRAGRWMGYRRTLADQIPERPTVITSASQQLALAHGLVMGIAENVMDQLPVIAEDDRHAWSEAGNVPHVVRVRYPVRPAYGRHPLLIGGVGVALFFGARWAQGFFDRVDNGESLQSLLDDIPDQAELVQRVAGILGDVMWLPIAWSVWAMVAGAIDAVITVERTGVVVRSRHPREVVPFRRLLRPFTERDRFVTYLAVDDGRRRRVTAWIANERSAAPQGAQAHLRATPILGYVRSSSPVGTSTRRAEV